MKNNITEMAFILDRSGSMNPLTNDTIGGFNAMIKKQKEEEGQAFVTTVLFDDQYELLYDHVDIQEVNELTGKEYYARGMTALLDAVGKTINVIGGKIAHMTEEERPEKVIVVITTDGMENSSVEYSRSQVKKMIKERQSKDGWTFIFLGANMDAAGEANSLGIRKDFARTYTANSAGTQSVYDSVTKAMSRMRCRDYDPMEAMRETADQSSSTSFRDIMESLDEVE